MKKIVVISLLVTFIVLPLSALLGFMFWYQTSIKPVSDSKSQIKYEVIQNQSGQSIISNLKSQGLIRSTLAARIYLVLNPDSTSFQPGTHLLSPSMDLKKVFATLSELPREVWITFPEGWRREQYAKRLNSVLSQYPDSNFSETEFLSQTAQLEGQLFPDSYLVPVNISSKEVVSLLVNTFKSKTGLDIPGDSQILTIASLIERESAKSEERRIVSGVIKNRLDQNWLLNIDATIQYARDSTECQKSPDCKYWTPLLSTNLDSLYNTYKYTGLPPGPICNPGLDSINAAKNPAETDYMYYLHAPDGQVYFAKTLDQHNQNIDKYLRP